MACLISIYRISRVNVKSFERKESQVK